MDLKDFIVSAISDISGAITEADEIVKSAGGLVNPGGHDVKVEGQGRQLPASAETFVAPRTTLNFDIAVSAESSKGGGASAKAKILVVEASLGGDAEARNSTVSRLTFSLDVVLPHDKNQAERLGKVKSK